jgi:serine/threonine-protein kinase
MIGQLLDGRYRIVRNLSIGGFGQTYVAQDTKIPGHPECVVKHLKPANSDPSYLQIASRLFTSEAETLAKLGNHDRIPRLLAYFTEGQEFYLVEEFVAGHPLGQELQPGQRWTESQVIQFLDDILETLEFVHSHGVIHRDIKPDNIMRRAGDRKFALIDFGAIKQMQNQLATQMESLNATVNATVAVGTPGYMPTEQAKGRPRPSSDLYALGTIAVQALTGVNPRQLRDDPQTGEIRWQHLTSVSAGLEAVVSKMTAYHFKDRYSTATEARQALSQLLSRSAVQLSPPSTPPTSDITEASFPPTEIVNPPVNSNEETVSNYAFRPYKEPTRDIPVDRPTQPFPQSTSQAFQKTEPLPLASPVPSVAPSQTNYQQSDRLDYQPGGTPPAKNGWKIALLVSSLLAAIGIGALIATKGLSSLLASISPSAPPTPISSPSPIPTSSPSPIPTSSPSPIPTSSPSPIPTPIPSNPPESANLTETEAVARVKALVEAKQRLFAPPFDRELLTELAVGDEYEKRKGSIDWLKANNAHYSYGQFEVKPLGQFILQGERATVEVEIFENPTLYVNGQVDKSQSIPSQGRYRCTLQFDRQSWKIATLTKI